MGETAYVQPGFHGGEWSQTYQGRHDDPHYRIAMNVCLNMFPTEQGAIARRSGSMFLQTTRGGAPGRMLSFAVNESEPLMLEFTDGFLRAYAFNGVNVALCTTNDAQTVSSISTANPAVVQTSMAHGWSTGNTVMFSGLGFNNPLLQNRQFLITVTDSTHFSLQDAITGANINGATLGAFVSGTVSRVLEYTTPYNLKSWQSIISVQAETQAVLLNGAQPQVLDLTSVPGVIPPVFTMLPSEFADGPYLDPFNGSIVTYNAQQGNVTLTFSFQVYSATTSYSLNDYVVSAGQGYQSLQDANLGNTPASSPAFWTPVNGGAPAGPHGFTNADIGRHIRLFSEPSPWAPGSTYTKGNVVKNNDGYWLCVTTSASISGIIPGSDPASWTPVTGINYALWTWGRIISISGTGLANVGATVGNLGQLSSAFDGTVGKSSTNCAFVSDVVETHPPFVNGVQINAGYEVVYGTNFFTASKTIIPWTPATAWGAGNVADYLGSYWQPKTTGPLPAPPGAQWTLLGPNNPTVASVWTFVAAAPGGSADGFGGANFSGSPKVIQSCTVIPSNDVGWGNAGYYGISFELRAKQTAPSFSGDGTRLGTASVSDAFDGSVSITSRDQSTAWNYVWVHVSATGAPPFNDDGTHLYNFGLDIAQIEFFTPSVSNGSVVTIQLAGDPLLYPPGTVVNTWRAGVFGNSIGWPRCGCYDQGRLWLGGSIPNRWDASVANDIFNFAPTGEDGTVADDNAISFIASAQDVNSTFWMSPIAQGIAVGTEGGEWLIQSGVAGAPLTPGTMQANRVTRAKCANVEPVHTEHTLVVVQRRQRKVLELFADIFSGKFTIPNLLNRAQHLAKAGITEIRYQQEITPTVWARCGDGSLIGCTYKRDTLMTSQGPTFYGWHRHQLGSGRVVESIATGPSQFGTLDSLFMVTNDITTGIRHVEMLADYFEETDNYANAWLLDDAVTPTNYTNSPTLQPALSGAVTVLGPGGYPRPPYTNFGGKPTTSLTIYGLWHLNNKTVTVFAGGLDCGDFVVANGSVTVPFGDGIAAGTANGLFTLAFVNSFPAGQFPLVVGFTYTSQGQLLRPVSPAESGARAGPALGKKRRNHIYALQAVQTNGLSVGTLSAKLDPVLFRSDTQASYPLPQLFSGVYQERIRDDYSFDGGLFFQVTRPVPVLIPAIGGMIETQDV
jgi:hypothetical protein